MSRTAVEMMAAKAWGITPPSSLYEYAPLDQALIVQTYITELQMAAWDAQVQAEKMEHLTAQRGRQG